MVRGNNAAGSFLALALALFQVPYDQSAVHGLPEVSVALWKGLWTEEVKASWNSPHDTVSSPRPYCQARVTNSCVEIKEMVHAYLLMQWTVPRTIPH